MHRRLPIARLAALVALASWLPPLAAFAYPLDGYEYTGLERVRVQRLIQEGQVEGTQRPPGELMPMEMVKLRLLDHPDLVIPPPDAALTAQIKRLVGEHVDRYGISLLDLSDLSNVRYAEWHGDQRQNPGSVGKILVALAIFQALADIYPDDIAAREKVLRTAMITADIYSVYDHHTVAMWDPATSTLSRRPIKEGDTATLWTYLDWMMSPSSNSAAGMLQKNLILMVAFGKSYPPSPEDEKRWFEETPRKERSQIFMKAITEPVTRNGLDIDALRQGSFFTHEGKRRVDGATSYATPRALLDYMVKMEQGKLVDAWSSLEIKRLLYITERRIRYGSSGVLRDSAVYFKSGSLYSCQEEEGFTCQKYHGNKRNYMNSAAIIESPAGQNHLYYMVTVLSNVLRKNSAQDHRDLARAIHLKLQRDHPVVQADGERPASLRYGEGFIGYTSERKELLIKVETQEALLALGYDIGDIDGVIGRNTRAAIQKFQASQGLASNGQPSEALVQTMRRVAEKRGLARPDAPEQE